MRLQGHSAKPNPRFYGKDVYHLGLELEIEAPDQRKRDEGLGLSKRPAYCYAKTDSSLNSYGWELVTHPISRAYWLSNNARTPAGKFFELVRGLQGLGYRSHDGGACGLHIHVGINAFRGVTPHTPLGTNRGRRRIHLYWFTRLINGGLFKRLSQRTGDMNYCKQVEIKAKDFHILGELSGARYRATNNTAKTMEVRIFRGNMREERIRKAIEAVIAAVEFSRGLVAADYRQYPAPHVRLVGGVNRQFDNDGRVDLERAFIQYVSRKKPLYPNLYAYLLETQETKTTEDTNSSIVEGQLVCA